MTIKGKMILAGIIVVFIVLIIYAFLRQMNRSGQFTDRPELRDHVEVIGKRRIPGDGDAIFPNYIVAFILPDGTVKELRVKTEGSNEQREREVYDSIHEGEKGILVYIEVENIEEKYKDDICYYGRLFIGFEKDP